MLWFVLRVSCFPFLLCDEVDGAGRVSTQTLQGPHCHSFTPHLQHLMSSLGRAVSCLVPCVPVEGRRRDYVEGAGGTPGMTMSLTALSGGILQGTILWPRAGRGRDQRCHSIPRGLVET